MMFISIQHNTAQSVFSVFRKLDISFVFSGEIFPFCSLCAFFFHSESYKDAGNTFLDSE